MILKRPSLSFLYPKMRLDEMLELAASRLQEKPFVVYPRKITYKEMDDDVTRVANGLRDIGVKKGNRIAIFSPNSPEYEMVVLAVSRCRGIVVPVNPTLKKDELNYILKDSEALAVFTVSSLVDTVREAAKGTQVKWICTMDTRIDDLYHIEDFLKYSAERFDPEIDPERDLVSINYTSGTTGPQRVLC